ncbi:multidrug resistance ABC transporter, ATP-binding protein [Arcobacter venerupis]|uniref:Multidrug resistance ABC transporter, ATP-binding protein n=1 Tax=Arcobacter venerupis TaxID=1054033 RepID=A0AAE7E3B2_9BACT|nr:ATP-binding cassette domain-containing protein [Arcobacter venerupis]QKF65797.1 multidrug resistance ABC transporter, ATP-binding protein [Arcobacter venerupis]RWS50304.1 multidrug ABC transporter ATP-binding protein [Arcobacter venerupis]
MSILSIKNLSKSFDKQKALNNISFEIKPNKITGIVGPDGAGKTTLLRILSGLLTYEAKVIEILDLDLQTNIQTIQEQIGYMPQKFGLYEDLSVEENLRLFADLQSIPLDNLQNRIDELLHFTSLFKFKDFLAKNLSGGMKQKLGLASALIKKPKLLLLDEPGVGVDPISRKELWSMVENLTKENVTVLWSTAYLDEAELCDEVLLLNEGNILFFGNPDILKDGMKDRVFDIIGEIKDKRETLSLALGYEYIKDALILGNSIKIICDESLKLPELKDIKASNCVYKKAIPTFEDGFMDILKANFDGVSKLAEQIKFIETTEENVIEVKNLTKKFGSFTATDDISFKIKKGQIFGLLGPNGAGKSTTFKMLCGLLKPSSGEASVLGYNFMNSSLKARWRIGYMSQKFSLYADISVFENLKFYAGIYGLKHEKKKQKITDMLDIFDLQRFKNVQAKDLPLGYKQRLALACAVMHDPAVLFLDEPTSGVDPITRREFWNHIYAMVQKGMTIMVTTHFMQEAEYCDQIALIYKGKAIAIDSPHELILKVSPNATMQEAFIELIKRSDDDEI